MELLLTLMFAIWAALLVPDVGEVQLLKFALGVIASEDQIIELYATNITPAEGDTFATYTLAAGGGYANKTLTKTSWTVSTSAGTTTGSYAQQTWTFTGVLTTNPDIYGYVVKSATTGILLWAEKGGAIFTPNTSGDAYNVTPAIQLA